MDAGARPHGAPFGQAPRLFPSSRVGWWAVGLAAAFYPLVFSAGVVPRAAALGFVCAVAGGLAAAAAIGCERERALTVFAALVPLAVAVAFALAQLIG